MPEKNIWRFIGIFRYLIGIPKFFGLVLINLILYLIFIYPNIFDKYYFIIVWHIWFRKNILDKNYIFILFIWDR